MNSLSRLVRVAGWTAWIFGSADLAITMWLNLWGADDRDTVIRILVGMTEAAIGTVLLLGGRMIGWVDEKRSA